MEINDLTSLVIATAIDVHRKLGPGLLESAYKECLFYELIKRRILVVKEKSIPLIYDQIRLECGYRADLVY